MSIKKWTGTHSQSETGILRKSDFKEKKEELFVFGYSCKLFRDDAKALHIDQGKHLIPWMGDDALKIDRYDARGALHDLAIHEAPQGGFDWRVELTRSEHEVEQLCDEERYRALHTDEEEELMYKEEELKRLHKAGYGQVGFNYDTPSEATPAQPAEVDEEPFIPTPAFTELMPVDIVFPETVKQNAIIDKTALFIANQGAQMEILIKAKQRDNPQFKFLNKDDPLHPYYMALTALVKAGKWPEKTPEVLEERHPENDDYLHPSLAAPIIESAPSIPSIHYKPSADCDYTMLISKMRGDDLAPGELPPPGTEPAPAPGTVIARAPILYNTSTPPPPPAPTAAQVYQQQYAIYYQQYMAPPPAPPAISTGLSLMKNYDSGESGEDSEQSESEEESKTNGVVKPLPVIPEPPDDIKAVIEKMAAYVARNGDEFADIVRAKNDSRFTFLEPGGAHHAYYSRLMRAKRGADANGAEEKKNKAPVSFSIKKQKEPDPILPKPALPYESSSDEDDEKSEKNAEEPEKPAKVPEKVEKKPEKEEPAAMPPVLVYKMEGQLTQNLPKVTTIEPLKFLSRQTVNDQKVEQKSPTEVTEKPKEEPKRLEAIEIKVVKPEVKSYDVQNLQKIELKAEKHDLKIVRKEKEKTKSPSPVVERKTVKKEERRESPDKRRENTRKRLKEEPRPKSESREYKRVKSSDREKRDKVREEKDRKRRKMEKDDLESEIISLEDNSNDDMIDLTGDQSDSKGEPDAEADKAKQLERRRRAAEFLKKVGVDPAGAASLPTNSLASAMVDTLESIRKKKAAEEEKRRRKEKRRRREKRDYEDEAEKSHRKSKRRKKGSSDDEVSSSDVHKKKKRKKDKKSTKSKKKKRHDSPSPEEEEDQPLPLNIDLTSTLKELRTNSPTKNLIIPDVETRVDSDSDKSEGNEDYRDEISEDKERKREYSEDKERKREYSEGRERKREYSENRERKRDIRECNSEERVREYHDYKSEDRDREREYREYNSKDRERKREYSEDREREREYREYNSEDRERRKEYSDYKSEEKERNYKSDDKERKREYDDYKSEEREKKREYSEGEWSSDSEVDSHSDESKRVE